MKGEITVTPPEEKSNESTALVAAPNLALAKVEKEKKLTFIKAWEESEKTKADNKAQKKMSIVTSWENSKKATKEADLRKTEEGLEKKKAEHGEKMKNKVALIHKQAEEKRAVIQAKRGEEILKAEEVAAKYRATGYMPKKFLGCF
ncbi:remorin isoform X2 [Eucalyptus grandis]|uniref:remorin isoform X2 n=1 Tax=Eucalyptus grandis TaxID=71139 RepID=UPI0008A0F025|nr:remorin isoform X2 [Eucalyptus grandis]